MPSLPSAPGQPAPSSDVLPLPSSETPTGTSTATVTSAAATPTMSSAPPRVRIRLTQHNHHPMGVSQSSPVPSPSPARLMSQGRMESEASYDSVSESLSPPPESPVNGLPMEDERDVKSTVSHTKPSRPRRAEPTFICSRDYAPLSTEPSHDQQKDNPKQRPERSKRVNGNTDGMNGNGGDSSSDASLDGAPNPSLHPLRKLQTLDTALPPLPLNTSSVEDERVPLIPTHHCTPRVSPPRTRKRLFDLDEAPTFYPTKEEFSDPLRYIEYVGDPKGGNGKAYGIVKIVPPIGWSPDFVLDQDLFRFRTRMQRLNSLSADARASLNYQEQLQKFHAQQGHARVSIPVVDRRPVDLYNLKLIVQSMGGYEETARGRKWAEVTRRLDYDERDACHLAAQIKNAYMRIILPFEKFLAANREAKRGDASESSRRQTRTPEQQMSASPSSSRGPAQMDAALTPSLGSQASAGLTVDVDNSLDDLDGSKRRSTRRRTDSKTPASGLPARVKRNATPDGGKVILQPGAEEQMCEICLRGDNGTAMLLCDECNRGYHTYCLDPPLTTIPKSQWYCPPCLIDTGNDYGFDDGDTHSLWSFWNRAESFRTAWWSERPSHITKEEGGQINGHSRPVAGTGLHVSEDDVEREFWRLVHSPDENVEVEYGADVHSTTHGSALPTLETYPLSPYARDGWNLNNLPILPGSLLRYIKSDISGMTVPWIYIGMIFSTFCWHNEDHHTYSINYQHFGDTKTWYGVPGDDAHKLEDAFRAAAPDLFEQSPDLLFQLVTMMSPDKLKKRGVRVYACNQRANEFVITYPKAYHSGFNHGFNINEAVNFALPDWIRLGLESVRGYQRFHRTPVFSHDELVVNIYDKNQSIDTAMWLREHMEEMVKREISKRNELRQMVPNLIEVVEEVDRSEVEYQCHHCKVFCYLGQVVSEKAEGVACLDHSNEVCGVDSPTKWTLRTRFSDESLNLMLQRTIERASAPTSWKARLLKVIVATPRPNLRNLRGLLNDGEKILYGMEELTNLRIFVEKANRWVDEATNLITRKHQKRNGVVKERVTDTGRRRKRASKWTTEEDEDMEQDEPGEQSRVYELLAEAEDLPFDANEIYALRAVVEAMEDFKVRAREIFQQIAAGEEPKLSHCENVLSNGGQLNIKLDEVDELQNYIGRRKWTQEVEDAKDRFLSLEDVESFLEEGLTLKMGQEEELMMMLRERERNGLEWKAKAEAILGLDRGKANVHATQQRQFYPDDAEELTKASFTIPADPDLFVKVETLCKHVKEWTRSCETLLRKEDRQKVEESEASEAYKRYLEAGRLLKHMDDSTIIITDKEKLLKRKETQDALEQRIFSRLFTGKWEPTMVPETAARIKAEYLDKAKDCLQEGDGKIGAKHLPCICRSDEGNKGAKMTCAQCQETYHIACLDLDKKEAKESRWVCCFCKPTKLRRLIQKQKQKRTLTDVRDILSPTKILLEERTASEPLHPWGQTSTFRTLSDAVESLSCFPSMEQMKWEDLPQKIHLLKKLIYWPVRLGQGNSADPAYYLAESIYLSHGLSVDGVEPQRVPIPATAPASQARVYQVDAIPPFRAPTLVRESAPREAVAPAHGDDSMQDVTLTGDLSDGEDGPSADASGKRITVSGNTASNEDGRRKRGKRAKFVFEEEVGIFVPVQGERVYCFCRQPETGTMISCERCSLWFHNTCVHVLSQAELGEERWICPMCCVKTERKYPYAEVKVRAPGETDPHLWLDIRATLRSTKKPVSKMQHWTAEPNKRIALHLESFYPAQHPTAQDLSAASTSNKRQRLNDGSPGPRHARGDSNSSGGDALPHNPNAMGSVLRNPSWNDVKARVTPVHRTPMAMERAQLQAQQAHERHRAGMANLYARGVTDAMIQKWYVGWNGRDLVYPRKDRYGVFHELLLGPRIQLAPDDQDGTNLITELLRQEAGNKHQTDANRDALRSQVPPSQSRKVDRESTQLPPQAMKATPPSLPLPGPSRSIAAQPQQQQQKPNQAKSRPYSSAWQKESQPALATYPPPALPPLPSRAPSQLKVYPAPIRSVHGGVMGAPSPSPEKGSHALPPLTSSYSARSPSGQDLRSPAPSNASSRSFPHTSSSNARRADASHSSQSKAFATPLGTPPSIPSPVTASHKAQSLSSPSPYPLSRPLPQSPRMSGAPGSYSNSHHNSHSHTGRSPSTPSSPLIQTPGQSAKQPSSAPSPVSIPQKSLEDYRVIARKMKPDATEDEIEAMVRHAIS